MKFPSISIVMCTYNGAAFLQQQLDSISSQSLPPDEVIIVDDCSTDTSALICERWAKHCPFRVLLLKNESNIGVTRNFARAISLAQCHFIALSDQDDYWYPNKLEVLAQSIKQIGEPGEIPILLYTPMRVIDGKDNVLAESFHDFTGLTLLTDKPWKMLSVQNPIAGCSCIFQRSAISHALPIPDNAIIHDWWIVLYFSLMGKIHRIDITTMDYRLHNQNAQGITTTFQKFVKLLNGEGISAATGNLTASRTQVVAMIEQVNTIKKSEGIFFLEKYLTTFDCAPWRRPVQLRKLGITRGSWKRNAVMYLASILLEKGYRSQRLTYQ